MTAFLNADQRERKDRYAISASNMIKKNQGRRAAPWRSMSPAGSLDILKCAFAAGADAVYAGGACFGARAFAQNFTEEELLEGIDYAHIHGKKLYLTSQYSCQRAGV